MKFIKENSYDIVRFFIYQLGIAVFSLTLAIPLETAVAETQSFYIIKSICFFVLPFVIVLAAHFGYTMGDKNKKIFGFLSNKKAKK